MNSAKQIAILTVVTLLLSIFLPLSAFAASEVHVSLTGDQNVSIKSNSSTGSNTVTFDKDSDDITPTSDEGAKDIDDTDTSSSRIISRTPTPTKTPTATPTPRVRRLRTPTPTKTPTPSPTAKPTKTPTPTPTTKPLVTATPTKQPTATPTQATTPATDEKKTYIMNAINDYRKSLGLSEVKTDTYTCSFAKMRAKEITTGFNHDGFRDRINNNSLPYPDYSQVTENLAMTSNYKNVVTMWINSPGHAENMRRNTPLVCVESSGNYYAYEGWRP